MFWLVEPKRERKPAARNDPKLIAAARELRDRWLEEVNAGRHLPASAGKYDVGKALAAPAPGGIPQLPRPVAA